MADIAMWEDTPIEWRHNRKHYAYGGRRWVARCPHCPLRKWTWETAEALRCDPRARAKAAARLRTAIAKHVDKEHR